MPVTVSILSQTPDEVLVYTDQKTIGNLVNSFGFQNVKVLYNEPTKKKTSKFRTFFRLFYTVLFYRYKMLHKLKKMHLKKVYFFHDTFGTMELWLAAKLSQSTEVLYNPVLCHKKGSELPKKYTFTYWYEKLFWNIDRLPLDYGKIRYTITDNFLIKNQIQTVNYPISIPDSIQQKLKKTYRSAKIVLLIEDVFSNPSVESQSYFSVINEIMDRLGSDNVVLKTHPRFSFDLQNLIHSKYNEMPSEIPINLIMNDFRFVIGNWTSVLFESQRNDNVCAISLMEILKPFYQQNLYAGHLRYLNDNDIKGTILYPKTIEELCQIIGGRL